MLAVTVLQVAVVVVTAAVVVLCAAFAVMEARRARNAGQYAFSSSVGRRPQAAISGVLVRTVPSLVDTLVDMRVQAVRRDLPMAS